VNAGRGVVAAALLALAATASAGPPERVVTLAPHLTELVYAAGAGQALVGTVAYSDYPAAARTLPRVGDANRIDRERLLALKPDLVILWADGTSPEEQTQIRALGIPVLALEAVRLEDVARLIEELGQRFGTEPIANAAAGEFRARVDQLRRRYAGATRLRVFYQVWDAPLYTLGGRHVMSEILKLCSADNVFAEQARGAFVVDLESVYARDPDVIVLAGSAEEARAWRKAWLERPRLRAVAGGALLALDPDLVDRMGPRLAAGAAQLCAGLDRLRPSSSPPAPGRIRDNGETP
jgi:iron complex transport system substrate-binding protein